jgi:hypothetical protein
MKTLFLIILLSVSQSRADLVDIFHKRTSSAVALADGFEDLADSVNEGSEISKNIDRFISAMSDARSLLSESDGAISDAKFIANDLSDDSEFVDRLHLTADKIRRAKRLARTLRLISEDPETSTAIQTSQTNIILSNMISKQQSDKLAAKEKSLQIFKRAASQEIEKDKSIMTSLSDIEKNQKASRIVFHPFNNPVNPGQKRRLADLYLRTTMPGLNL